MTCLRPRIWRVIASCLTGLCFPLIFVCYVSPNWLALDYRSNEGIFVRLGLWEMCFRNFHDPSDYHLKEFSGCRWYLTDEYFRGFIEQPFFIAVQVFFTIGFTTLMVSCVLVFAVHLCLNPKKDHTYVRIIAILMLFAAVCCAVAVTSFGIKDNSLEWMPDPDHTYLSWAFGLAVVGTFFIYIASVLFFIEASQAEKRNAEIQRQVATYHLEQAHTRL